MTKVVVIAAVGDWLDQHYIGESNRMPWDLPRDMRFFRTVTDGGAVIMGRKTFDSLGKRPLPNRTNIVVTRQHNYAANKTFIAHSLEEALSAAESFPFAFVIGGGQLYEQAMVIANHLLITEIRHTSHTEPLFEVFRGDTFFPRIDPTEWKCVRTSRWFRATAAKSPASLPRDYKASLHFRFLRFDRTKEVAERIPAKLFFGRGRLVAKRTRPVENPVPIQEEIPLVGGKSSKR